MRYTARRMAKPKTPAKKRAGGDAAALRVLLAHYMDGDIDEELRWVVDGEYRPHPDSDAGAVDPEEEVEEGDEGDELEEGEEEEEAEEVEEVETAKPARPRQPSQTAKKRATRSVKGGDAKAKELDLSQLSAADFKDRAKMRDIYKQAAELDKAGKR